MAKFEVGVGTGVVNSMVKGVIQIPDEDLEGIEETEKEELIQEVFNEWMWQKIDTYCKEVPENV